MKKMKRKFFLSIGMAALLSVSVFAEEENADALTQIEASVQEITDAVNGLSADSDDKAVEEVLALLEETTFEAEETEEPAKGLTGSMTSMGNTASVQMLFAQLQQQQASAVKNEAMERMKEIQEQQSRQKECTQFINTARETAASLKTGETAAFPDDMKAFMSKNGLYYPQGSVKNGQIHLNKDEWDVVLQNLVQYLEALGTQTQQLMAYIQNYMGQYNSYVQQASQAIQNTNQSLASISRGQTMLGVGSGGMAVTCVLLGAVLGCVGTLFAGKYKKRTKA